MNALVIKLITIFNKRRELRIKYYIFVRSVRFVRIFCLRVIVIILSSVV